MYLIIMLNYYIILKKDSSPIHMKNTHDDRIESDAHRAEEMTEELALQLDGRKRLQFLGRCNILAEQYGLATNMYRDQVHESFVRLMGVPREKGRRPSPHFITGSTRKPGSHASSRHH